MISLINWLVDPYRIFGSPTVDGLNRVKPEVVKNDRAAKTQMILRMAPDALILGNSRSLNGIPTRNPAWAGYTVFNGALTAGRIEEAFDILRFAHAHRPVRRVLLNIDELGYRSGTDPTVGADPDRYRLDTPGRWKRALDQAGALVTDRGIRASIRTWSARHGQLMPSDAAVILEDGSIDQGIFYRALAARGGAREAFRRVEAQARSHRSEAGGLDLSGPAATLREMLNFARRNGIEIAIYFPPLHARALAGMKIADTLGELFKVRRSVVEVVMREAAESGGAPARLFDFLAVNEMSTESIPSAREPAKRMTWFFEGSHFTQSFGHVILLHVYAASSALPAKMDEVMIVDENSAASREAKLESEILHWIAGHAEEASDVAGPATVAPKVKQSSCCGALLREAGLESRQAFSANQGLDPAGTLPKQLKLRPTHRTAAPSI